MGSRRRPSLEPTRTASRWLAYLVIRARAVATQRTKVPRNADLPRKRLPPTLFERRRTSRLTRFSTISSKRGPVSVSQLITHHSILLTGRSAPPFTLHRNSRFAAVAVALLLVHLPLSYLPPARCAQSLRRSRSRRTWMVGRSDSTRTSQLATYLGSIRLRAHECLARPRLFFGCVFFDMGTLGRTHPSETHLTGSLVSPAQRCLHGLGGHPATSDRS